MYGSQLLTESAVDAFGALGMRFIDLDDPAAKNYSWHKNTKTDALLIASTGQIGHLRAMPRVDVLQLDGIHQLIDKLRLSQDKQVRGAGYGSTSTKVLRVLNTAAETLAAKGYDPTDLGPALGIYNSLGQNGRAGRNLVSCIKAAHALADRQVEANIFYGLLDQLRGAKCLERTTKAYQFVADNTHPAINMTLVRELFN